MKPNTLTLKIINDQDILDSFPKPAALTEQHQALIKMIVQTTIDEYVKRTKPEPQPTVQMERLLRMAEVAHITGLSRSSIYYHISRGEFPKPIKISERSVRWREREIRNWLSC